MAADWINKNNFRVRLSMKIASPDHAGPFKNAMDKLACAADHEIVINVNDHTISHEGDNFPAIGAYWFGPDTATPRIVSQMKPGSVDELCGEKKYTHGGRRNAPTSRP